MDEWNWEKNKDLNPNTITSGSRLKAHWICGICGHHWQATVASRCQGCGCPLHYGNAVQAEINSLSAVRPDLAMQWDYEKNNDLPTDYTCGSKHKAWWRCDVCGNSWRVSIGSRSTNNTNCPYCSHQKVTLETSLQTLYPEIAEEWDYECNTTTPDKIFSKSTIHCYWICPRCNGGRAIPGYNDLETLFPELMEEWDWEQYDKLGLNPSAITQGSSKKAVWRCKKYGVTWKAAVYHLTHGSGSPYVGGLKKAVPNVTSFSAVHPELLDEWDYEKNNMLNIFPDQLLPFSSKKVWWKCKNCNKSYKASITIRSSGNQCFCQSGRTSHKSNLV